MPQKPYQQMLSYNSFLKRKFGLHGKDGEKLILYEPTRAIAVPKGGIFPSFNGLGKTVTPTVLEKKTLYSNSTTHAKLSVINQDKQYQTLVYVTTPQKLKEALRNGVFDAHSIQDPLAKMIAEIGSYKRIVFERSTELQVAVTKNQERLAVADLTQTLIEILQPLNQCINNYAAGKTPEENLRNILDKTKQLDKEIENIINANKAHNEEPYLTLMSCAATLRKQTQQYRQLLTAMKNPSEEQVKAILGSYGTRDNLLKYFLQQQINVITQSAIDANYAVTGLYQDASGLSQALLNAQFTGEAFSSQRVDYHNAISKEHGLDFSAKEKNGLVAVDLAEYGFQPKSSVELAKRVALIQQIEEGKKLYNDTDDTVRLVNFSGKKGTIPGSTAAKKVGFIAVNFMLDIGTTVLDLAYSVYAASVWLINLGLRIADRTPFKIPPFPSERSVFQKWDIAEDAYSKLDATQALFGNNALTQINNSGIFVKAFQFIGTQLINLTIKPLVEVVKGLTVNIWDGIKNIYYDVTIGRKPISDNEIGRLLHSRLQINAEITEQDQQAVEMLLQKNNISYDSVKFEEVGEAGVDYQLNPDKPEDLVSWASNDFIKGMVEVFSQEIYRAHPLGGLAFTLAATTATPMLMPFAAKYAFLHFIYTKLNIPIAKSLVGETHGFMSAFSTAMIEGKAAFFLTDLTNGKESILVRGVELLFENPVLAGLIGTAAIGLGYEIAFKANIPWLSEEIASEAGHASFPYLELGLSGAKLAAIVIESGIRYEEGEEEAAHILGIEAKMEELRPEIKEAMTVAYKRRNNIEKISVEEEQQIESQVTQYLDTFKKALESDYSDVMVNSVAGVIAEYASRYTGAPSSYETNAPVTNKLQENFKRAHIREQILQLDTSNLPQDEKYKIMHYVNTHYANDPEYVAAVKYRFMDGREKIGGLAGSIKMVLSYIPAVARAVTSLITSAILGIGSLRNPNLKSQALMALQPAKDLLSKVRADVGLIVKAGSTLARVSWGLVGSILRVPIVALYSLFASPVLVGQYFASRHYLPTPLEMNSKLSDFFFAPGKVSQFFNALNGFFREAASAKNLELATKNISAQETAENIVVLEPLLTKKMAIKKESDTILAALVASNEEEDFGEESTKRMFHVFNSQLDKSAKKAEVVSLSAVDVTHADHPLAFNKPKPLDDDGEEIVNTPQN
ncbi:hypothetical protein [Legionella cardiaca]|uniref:Coiled-coil protein n=1 Tax=Legionella cardiaca TaxID=1071983 RepID=A0ABY8AN54_9GAMM|nr:hypothetical protein [Legionella cardiaca]WED42077.1 hypothetical protein PXX05_09035 [Legionella cardiaca]